MCTLTLTPYKHVNTCIILLLDILGMGWRWHAPPIMWQKEISGREQEGTLPAREQSDRIRGCQLRGASHHVRAQ